MSLTIVDDILIAFLRRVSNVTNISNKKENTNASFETLADMRDHDMLRIESLPTPFTFELVCTDVL